LNGSVKVGRRVVIIGGEIIGCETAEFLAEHGRVVTVTSAARRWQQAQVPLCGRTSSSDCGRKE
jgi:NADPH-dependent 2,4-dienoyl-CoA reductase/sulfur reductase-like enzyme